MIDFMITYRFLGPIQGWFKAFKSYMVQHPWIVELSLPTRINLDLSLVCVSGTTHQHFWLLPSLIWCLSAMLGSALRIPSWLSNTKLFCLLWTALLDAGNSFTFRLKPFLLFHVCKGKKQTTENSFIKLQYQDLLGVAMTCTKPIVDLLCGYT